MGCIVSTRTRLAQRDGKICVVYLDKTVVLTSSAPPPLPPPPLPPLSCVVPAVLGSARHPLGLGDDSYTTRYVGSSNPTHLAVDSATPQAGPAATTYLATYSTRNMFLCLDKPDSNGCDVSMSGLSLWHKCLNNTMIQSMKSYPQSRMSPYESLLLKTMNLINQSTANPKYALTATQPHTSNATNRKTEPIQRNTSIAFGYTRFGFGAKDRQIFSVQSGRANRIFVKKNLACI